jgi:hypothetical protein
VLARFGQLQEEKRDTHRAEDSASETEKINIAKEANTIALAAAVAAADATEIARSARKISWLAAIASVVAAIY